MHVCSNGSERSAWALEYNRQGKFNGILPSAYCFDIKYMAIIYHWGYYKEMAWIQYKKRNNNMEIFLEKCINTVAPETLWHKFWRGRQLRGLLRAFGDAIQIYLIFLRSI